MELLFQFFLLCTGLGFLWKVGEHSVQNAIGVSNAFGVARFTVGFFIFAISTGLPEISSAVISSIKGIPELSAGDLTGSTFMNLSLILGLALILAKNIELDPSLRRKLLWTSWLILVIFSGLVFTHFHKLFSGILLIVIYFGSFFLFQTKKEKKEVKKELEEIEEKVETVEKKPFISLKVDVTVKLIGSLILLLLSSWITVRAADRIASLLQISLPIVGASLVAIGTSLPELSLEIHSIRRKEYALALGDIFGSSLLNVSLVLGMLIVINKEVNLSIARVIFPFVIAIFAWVFLRIYPRKPLRRADGFVFLTLFVIYITTLALLQTGFLSL